MHTPLPTAFALEAPLNGLAWSPDGTTCAAAMGDGTVALLRPTLSHPVPVQLEGTPLCLIATPEGFAVGTDTGHVVLISPQGETTPLATFPGQFIEHMVHIPKRHTFAVAVGKRLALVPPTGEPLFCAAACPSTIAGLALSPLGPRVAASHYGGVSIFDATSPQNLPRTLAWKGSHLGLTYAPSGKWLISAMQERAIHLWRLSDGLDLQMRGYPGPITQFGWSAKGTHLATTGGSGVPLWDFSNPEKGPAGQQATVLAESGSPELTVTALSMHPKGPFCAVGFADGLVLLTNFPEDRAVLLQAPAQTASAQSPITHMAFSPDGLFLATGTATGTLSLIDFTKLT